jgi:hypothetical protein
MRAEATRYPADAKDAREAGSSVVERLEPTVRGDPEQTRNQVNFFGARPAARERRRQAPSGRVAARTTGC